MKLDRIQLGFDWCEDLPYVIDAIIKQHETIDYSTHIFGHNFIIKDWKCNKLLYPLYDYFYEHILCDDEYAQNSMPKPIFFAYVVNNKRWSTKNAISRYHDHKTTAAANGVFYVKIPTCDKSCPEDGAILVKEDWESKEIMLHPKEGELMVYPGSYPHCPLGVETDEYRISINVETRPIPLSGNVPEIFL